MPPDPPPSRLPSLRDAAWLQRPETRAVFAALNRDGGAARAVGGAVRNTLLGTPVHDIDIATTSPPEVTVTLAERAGLRAIPTGLDHGTVTVVAARTPFEVTTLRRDVETFGRHARVAFTDDWAADARRRDFTINALYCDSDGTLFDPLDGYEDVKARRVRFIGEADARIREDYLRILRFFRFTAEYAGGDADAQGLAACAAAREKLTGLSRERVRAELLRLLAAPHAIPMVRQIADAFLAQLIPVALDVPLFAHAAAIEADLGWAADGIRRLGALTGARPGRAEALQEALRLSSQDSERLAQMGLPDPALSVDAPEDAAKTYIYRHGVDAFVDGALIAWARSGDGPDDARSATRLQLAKDWSAPEFPVRGGDVLALGIPAGPQVGRVLALFEEWWIAASFPSDSKLLAGKLTEIARDEQA